MVEVKESARVDAEEESLPVVSDKEGELVVIAQESGEVDRVDRWADLRKEGADLELEVDDLAADGVKSAEAIGELVRGRRQAGRG